MTEPEQTPLPDPGNDPGVTLATGAPRRLFAAATHDTMADTFQAHSTAVSGAAHAVSGGWSGDSAFAYQALSSEVSSHFANVSTTARGAARSLRNFGTALEHSQEQGQRALTRAKHWLAEKRTLTTRYNDASRRVAQAKRDVAAAEAALSGPTGTDPTGAVASAAAGRLKQAKGDLVQAQADQTKARNELDHASRELANAQRLGDEAWHDAQMAAIKATGEIAPLELPAPPMPGQVINPITGGSPGNPLGDLGWTDGAGSGTSVLFEFVKGGAEGKAEKLSKGRDATRQGGLDAYQQAVAEAEADGFSPESTAKAVDAAKAIQAARVAGGATEDEIGVLKYVKVGADVVPVLYVGVDTVLNREVGHQSLPVAAAHATASAGGFAGGMVVCSEAGPIAVVCGVAGGELGEHPGQIKSGAQKVVNSPWSPWGAAKKMFHDIDQGFE